MPYCKTRDETSIHYNLHGDTTRENNNRILFIMGFGADSTVWDFQANYFSQTHCVCTFDNRGIGFSDAPSSRYTTTQMALDALDLLNHLNWTNNVNIVGYSLGGMVSLELCSQAPLGLIASLVIVSSTAGFSLPPLPSLLHVTRQRVSMSVEQHFSWAMSIVHPQEWLMSPNKRDSSILNKDVLWNWRLDRHRRKGNCSMLSKEGFFGQRMAVSTHFVSKARLVGIKKAGYPVLVVTGGQDQLVRPTNSYHLAKWLGGQLFIFDSAGHGVIHQYCDEFNLLLKYFWSQQQQQCNTTTTTKNNNINNNEASASSSGGGGRLKEDIEDGVVQELFNVGSFRQIRATTTTTTTSSSTRKTFLLFRKEGRRIGEQIWRFLTMKRLS